MNRRNFISLAALPLVAPEPVRAYSFIWGTPWTFRERANAALQSIASEPAGTLLDGPDFLVTKEMQAVGATLIEVVSVQCFVRGAFTGTWFAREVESGVPWRRRAHETFDWMLTSGSVGRRPMALDERDSWVKPDGIITDRALAAERWSLLDPVPTTALEWREGFPFRKAA